MFEDRQIHLLHCIISSLLLKRLLLLMSALLFMVAMVWGSLWLFRDRLLVSQAKMANWGVVDLLLEWGADPDAVGSDGVPAIWYAALYKDQSGIYALIHGLANVNPPLKTNNAMLQAWITSPLALCVSHDDVRLAKMLLDGRAQVTAEEMWRVRSKAMLRILLRYGGDIRSKSKHGLTPMYGAVTAEDDDPELVEELLKAGLPANITGRDGLTPLHSAVAYGNLRIAEALICAGANVNAADDSGATPLRSAMQRNMPDMAKMLRQHGGHE